jgi:NADPH-dependent 2,4-dienoyl-CoA reductase/sulfur reductase-like enzyme
MADARENQRCEVAIIGGGPAGLAAATALRHAGVGRVVVLEREAEAGGIPRHCGHPPFGMREFGRVMAGPGYARRLVQSAEAANVEIALKTTVTALGPEGALGIASPDGPGQLKAERVLLATGVREMPRAARLVSGNRGLGVCNTGALQSMVYLKNRVPFRRPLVVGTELVSFSALLTCRKAGIRPVAMVEENPRATARWPLHHAARLFGVPLLLKSRITSIAGRDRVGAVRILDEDGDEREITCDGVLFTGRFTPESSLARMSHLALDSGSGGPVIDQFGRCSDPAYFAAGNVLRPVETAGWSWREGRSAARWIARDLAGDLPAPEAATRVEVLHPVKLAVPQRIAPELTGAGMTHLQVRLDRPARGCLTVANGAGPIWSRAMSSLPERRILIPIASLKREPTMGGLTVGFIEERTA